MLSSFVLHYNVTRIIRNISYFASSWSDVSILCLPLCAFPVHVSSRASLPLLSSLLYSLSRHLSSHYSSSDIIYLEICKCQIQVYIILSSCYASNVTIPFLCFSRSFSLTLANLFFTFSSLPRLNRVPCSIYLLTCRPSIRHYLPITHSSLTKNGHIGLVFRPVDPNDMTFLFYWLSS